MEQQTQNKEFFAIEKNLLIGVLTYLNGRPHGEVADAITALKSLPPVRLELTKESTNEPK